MVQGVGLVLAREAFAADTDALGGALLAMAEFGREGGELRA
ncbi:MAG TPA: hypothetical protein VFG30_15440 [Polyangiales bacterium]|nr:hypothetical protein [Polyangiales bacterium]